MLSEKKDQLAMDQKGGGRLTVVCGYQDGRGDTKRPRRGIQQKYQDSTVICVLVGFTERLVAKSGCQGSDADQRNHFRHDLEVVRANQARGLLHPYKTVRRIAVRMVHEDVVKNEKEREKERKEKLSTWPIYTLV